jgi:hypothetical protein
MRHVITALLCISLVMYGSEVTGAIFKDPKQHLIASLLLIPFPLLMFIRACIKFIQQEGPQPR